MGNKIQKIFVGTNQVRPTVPPDITEVYTQHGANQIYSIYKSNYKVKSFIMERQGSYSGSSWYITSPEFRGGGKQFNCICSLGGSYGYNYGDGQGKYGGIRIYDGSSWSGLVSINSSSTTSSRNAGKIIVNLDGFEYYIGKEYGTWLQTGTYTFNSTQKQNMEVLFSSNDTEYRTACWNNSTDTFSSFTLTVTYEPV